MNTYVKLYTDRIEVIEHEIMPFIRPFENEYSLTYLMDNLIAKYVDGDGRIQAYGLKIFTDEERNRILRDAREIAERYPKL